MIIKNTQDLLDHGNVDCRKICLDLIETALKSVDLFSATKNSIRIKDNVLTVNERKYALSEVDRIFVIGGGKASFPIAEALVEILGSRIESGIISVKKGEKRRLERIKVVESGHPLPDKNSEKVASEIVDLTQNATKRDLFICTITGGASSLLAAPAGKISLHDKIRVNELLLNSGAPINVINSVRNHISKIKGGNLALLISPAKILNLIAIDEVEGLPWGPTVADRTTFNDSIEFLNQYKLWTRMPSSVQAYLKRGLTDKKLETPKETDLRNLDIQTIILASNDKMLDSVYNRSRELGLNAAILSSRIQGESSEVGKMFGCIALEVQTKSRPWKPPCVLIGGGETTVTVGGKGGKGGPSQEFVLGAALEIASCQNITIASLDTDGTDGPTDVAGGLCDGETTHRARDLTNRDIVSFLKSHSSYKPLKELRDNIITGPTETNVMDLNLAVIL